ncbi:polyprenyl diphosphate synthase [Treponema sp.]
MTLPTEMDPPAHIGIIMDGNGRWARNRGLARTQGHGEGLKTAKRIVQAASDLGIKYLTLYTFSTENWKRAAEEVGFLMSLIRDNLVAEFDFYKKNGIRIRFTGNLAGLPKEIANEIVKVCKDTEVFTGLSVILALNYGGRDEIIRAVRKIISLNIKEDAVDEAFLASHLDNPDVPNPDLIIRTAGEQRLSNFLLWETAYSEYVFSDTLWPDWTREDLEAALLEYRSRDRRFGAIKK